MELALIAPTAYLDEFIVEHGLTFQMAIAHRVLQDKAYATFYRQRALAGDSVILDNSASYLGASIAGDQLMRAIEKIKPTQVVAPDVLDDAAQTKKLTTEFIAIYGDQLSAHGTTIMGVAQGATEDEWLECCRWMNDNPAITTIGQGGWVDFTLHNPTSPFPRVALIKEAVRRGCLTNDKRMHILGVKNSGHLEIAEFAAIPEVASIDTVAPIALGSYGIRIETAQPYVKYKEKFDPALPLNHQQRELAHHNIQVFIAALDQNTWPGARYQDRPG